nr:hypothetical protein [Tanacetum cinerariifolium]
MKEKGDACIFVGYSTRSRAYKVFNKRTRVIVDTIHVNFDELPQMASEHVSSHPAPECQRMALEHDSLSPGPQCQENVTQADKTVTTSNELDLLFSLMFDELLKGSSKVVSKSSANMNQAEMVEEYAQVENDEFINIFCTLVQDRGKTSSRHVDSSNMHTFYQHHPSEHRWTKDHPLKQVIGNPSQSLVEIVLFIIDSGCSKHMTGNLKLLTNFVEKFLGTVKFRNDQIAHILGYGDLVQGAVMIKQVYYVEGMNHNLFSVDQLCDADLEVAFWKSTCYIRDLKGNDLLIVTSSQSWLWHRRLSHLKFDTINLLTKNDIVVGLPKLKLVKDHLCSSCVLGKAKRKSFQTKITPISKSRLQLLHMDLCGPMRVASINVKRYVLVIVDDYSRYTWTHFLRSKEETPETLHAYFAAEGIRHQTSVARTPEQNGIVERQNRTLVEAARTMLSAAKLTDYGFHFDKIPMYCDSKAAIAISCNTVQHSRTMHIDVRYHFIKEKVKKGIVELFFVETEYQLAALFTKALPEERFKYLVRRLGMRCLTPNELEVLANESA